jgi:hypothetical protein
MELVIAADRIIVPVREVSGPIWTIEHVDR